MGIIVRRGAIQGD
jgi:hypothetical protein